MPKIVDADVRRRDVAEAVFRVVARDGFAQASLRNVADEAGLAIGSVRHYCGTHEELMTIALDALVASFRRRLTTHLERRDTVTPGSREHRRLVEDVLAEFLPLDDKRRREIVVWLEFSVAARVEWSYRQHLHGMTDVIRSIVYRTLDGMSRAGMLPDTVDLGRETDRLWALLDGLALAVVTAPETVETERMMEVLRSHLDQLSR